MNIHLINAVMEKMSHRFLVRLVRIELVNYYFQMDSLFILVANAPDESLVEDD